MLWLPKNSFGIGDRFGRQAIPLLEALIQAQMQGVYIAPVANKSFREHERCGTNPSDVLSDLEEAISIVGWQEKQFFVDADHVKMGTVGGSGKVGSFIDSSNFFTLDVGDDIGGELDDARLREFIADHKGRKVRILDEVVECNEAMLTKIGRKYLPAILKAKQLFEHIRGQKREDFVVEVSMDEVPLAQEAIEIYFVLAELGKLSVPAQTIAPKFIGDFYKGVDYVGDVNLFARQYRQFVAVIKTAIKEFGLPNLKPSIHSGSDKFSLYRVINKINREMGIGCHLKTAGTTWLQEFKGIVLGGDKEIADRIYSDAYARRDELIQPYKDVVRIDDRQLLKPGEVARMGAERFVKMFDHNQREKLFNPHIRQLLHIAYTVAAEMGTDYTDALDRNIDIIAAGIKQNTYHRHAKPLFVDVN